MTRTALAVLLCCCAGLTATACSGGSSTKTPGTSVTAPSVGKPPMASSIAAALAKQAFTPYAELGDAAGDGLAPNEAASSLGTACMTGAGYPNAPTLLGGERVGDTLRGTTDFGAFGYVGTTQAAQYGFLLGGGGPGPDAGLSGAEQDALYKCLTIVQNFSAGQQNSTLAGVGALGQAIQSDESKDPSIAKATKAWAACMTADGYESSSPNALIGSVMAVLRTASKTTSTGGGRTITSPSLTAAQNAAQIAEAESDAACTQSTDLAGIFFAVQASYEQQIVQREPAKAERGGSPIPRRVPEGTGQTPRPADDHAHRASQPRTESLRS